MLKWIDLPPVWLVGFLVVGAALPRGNAIVFGQALIGLLLILVGVVLMVLAVIHMTRHKTTVIPHREPDAMVTTGVFGLSRNPIYLGDVFVLAGFLLFWQPSILALLLLPAFMWVIAQRFIKQEESRLSAKFGDAFQEYCSATRRWL